MCEISEKWYREGEEHGKIEGEKKPGSQNGSGVKKNGTFRRYDCQGCKFQSGYRKTMAGGGRFPRKVIQQNRRGTGPGSALFLFFMCTVHLAVDCSG